MINTEMTDTVKEVLRSRFSNQSFDSFQQKCSFQIESI